MSPDCKSFAIDFESYNGFFIRLNFTWIEIVKVLNEELTMACKVKRTHSKLAAESDLRLHCGL